MEGGSQAVGAHAEPKVGRGFRSRREPQGACASRRQVGVIRMQAGPTCQLRGAVAAMGHPRDVVTLPHSPQREGVPMGSTQEGERGDVVQPPAPAPSV